jgi:outer membrane biosynthesis protein TonB
MWRAIALLAGMIACATASAQPTALSPALQPDPITSTTDCEQESKFANDDVGTMLRAWRIHPPDLHPAAPMDLDYIVIPLPDAAHGMHRIQISHEKPQPVIHPDPEYSTEAADKGIKGTVKLQVFVAQDGAVKKTLVVCGNPLLVPAAQAALQKWTYRPVLLNDQPVEFVINEIKLSFPPVSSRQQ